MSSEIKEYIVEEYDKHRRVMYHVKEFLKSNDIVNITSSTKSSPNATRAAESLARLGYVTLENIQTITDVSNNRRRIKLIITVKKTANFDKLYKENEEERKKREEENKNEKETSK